MAATTWARFGPDPPFSSLPADFQACVGATPGAGCDALVGSAAEGSGYCARPEYAQTTYCACANSAFPCPHVSLAACANSEYAYRPAAMRPGGAAAADCAGRQICASYMPVFGSDNTVKDNTQQCGTFKRVTLALGASPGFAAALLLLALVFAAVVARANPTLWGLRAAAEHTVFGRAPRFPPPARAAFAAGPAAD